MSNNMQSHDDDEQFLSEGVTYTDECDAGKWSVETREKLGDYISEHTKLYVPDYVRIDSSNWDEQIWVAERFESDDFEDGEPLERLAVYTDTQSAIAQTQTYNSKYNWDNEDEVQVEYDDDMTLAGAVEKLLDSK
jgi:hypothetical protein